MSNKLFNLDFNKYYNNPLWYEEKNNGKVYFKINDFISHDLQKYHEKLFSDTLPIRNFAIRLNNQIYYSLFRKSYSYDNKIIIGKQNQLFELIYIDKYCQLHGPPYTKNSLIQWANKLKKINDFFTKKGEKFIYVITPSKAEYLPTAIPNRFHCHKQGISSHILLLEKLLTQRGIPYVNSSRLMKAATTIYKTSMFPRGGTHWNSLAGGIAANAIIETINQLGPPALNTLAFDYQLTKNPEGSDADLLSLLNLFKENKNYTVPKLSFKSTANPPITLVMVGDSFSDQLLSAFVKGNTFEKLTFYRYFKFSKTIYKKNNPTLVQTVNIHSPDILDAFLSADIIVLEENTVNTISEHNLLFYRLMDKFIFNNR